MPIMQVYYPQGSLPAERKAALAQQLTDVLLLMEGNAKTAGGLGFASVLFTEVLAIGLVGRWPYRCHVRSRRRASFWCG